MIRTLLLALAVFGPAVAVGLLLAVYGNTVATAITAAGVLLLTVGRFTLSAGIPGAKRITRRTHITGAPVSMERILADQFLELPVHKGSPLGAARAQDFDTGHR